MDKKRIFMPLFLFVAMAVLLTCTESVFADNEEATEEAQEKAIQQVYQDQKEQFVEDQRQDAQDQVREDIVAPPSEN